MFAIKWSVERGLASLPLIALYFLNVYVSLGGSRLVLTMNDGLKFLPCVIPNCTVDYSCSEAAPPVQDKESRANASIFDPCHWTDCGGGTCKETSIFTHSCECTEGYNNLLNVTAFPCFRECMLGLDCPSLGITGMNKSYSSTTGLANIGNNQASLISRGNIYWSIIVVMSFAPILWR
ncbi:hypothetical protein F0562_034965 [Nyssa sinensis]|uniref:EGF-like domain-containing protein n=1 Tax=Nyssa sinensis TaxID=561372 RepID=A0A5J5AAS2_9ASTE|nr:hypothetical protein F0562_034965 [Nyssa sinensis]